MILSLKVLRANIYCLPSFSPHGAELASKITRTQTLAKFLKGDVINFIVNERFVFREANKHRKGFLEVKVSVFFGNRNYVSPNRQHSAPESEIYEKSIRQECR